MITYKTFKSPIGEMMVAEFDSKLVLLEFYGPRSLEQRLAPLERYFGVGATAGEAPTLRETLRQLGPISIASSDNSILP